MTPLHTKGDSPTAGDGESMGGGGGGLGGSSGGKPPKPPLASSGRPPATALNSSGGSASSRPPPPPPPQDRAGGAPPDATPRTGSATSVASRDTSGTAASATGGSVASDDSRRALRRTMLKKKKSLRQCEFGFLENLLKEGDDAELERAREKLGDTNLFFEDEAVEVQEEEKKESGSADAVAKPEPLKGGSVRHPSDEVSRHENSAAGNWDAPSDEVSSSVNRPRSKSMFARTPDDSNSELGLYEGGEDDDVEGDVKSKLGSKARLEAVANRRQQSNLRKSMWRAHESGLLVTPASSQKSIARRRTTDYIATASPALIPRKSSIDFGGGSRRAAFLDSVGRESFLSESTIEVVEDGGPLHIPGEDDVFRGSSGSLSERLTDKERKNLQLPSIPRPHSIGRGQRAASVGSTSTKQSVTFKAGHDLFEFAPGKHASDGPTKTKLLPLRPMSHRPRSISLGTMHRRYRLLSDDSTSPKSEDSTPKKSNSSLGRPPPAVRSDSVASEAPSLNLHRAHPIRSDSIVSEAPSLNLHRANHIRSDSVVSEAPSLNLHRANHIRSDSVVSEAPSLNLHRAHHIMSESTISVQPSPLPSPSNLARPFPIMQRESSVADSVLTFDDGSASDAVASPDSSPMIRRKEKITVAGLMQLEQQRLQQQKPPPLPRPPLSSALRSPSTSSPQTPPATRPVLMRMASENAYDGEGVEVAELDTSGSAEAVQAAMSNLDSIDNARRYRSMMSDVTNDRSSIYSSFNSMNLSDFLRTDIFRRSLSFDGGFGEADTNASALGTADDANQRSWDLESDPEQQDAWNVLTDEYAVGYSTIPFTILGTSADEVNAQPHVLSPPLMESLQPFFPYAVSEDNFWMKYSLLRDGASLHTLLQNIRGAKYTIIGIETLDGEVFGSFTSAPWRKNWNFFGNGESFLWKMRQSRDTQCHSVIDQARLESELEVYPWTGENNFVQLCTSNKIAVGGGTEKGSSYDMDDEDGEENTPKTSWDHDDTPFGFGLSVDDTLFQGCSNPCLTFGSPSLSKKHSDGSPFEILNLEVWTLTPCMSLEEAEKLELGRLFLEDHEQQ